MKEIILVVSLENKYGLELDQDVREAWVMCPICDVEKMWVANPSCEMERLWAMSPIQKYMNS